MARFTSVHPLTLTEPAARFTPVEGDPELFEVVSDDPAVILSLRHLGEAYGVVEDGDPVPVEAPPVAEPAPELTPAEQETQPVPVIPDTLPAE